MNISYLQNHFINSEAMKLREAFETYNFENAGQFSGIASHWVMKPNIGMVTFDFGKETKI